MARRISAQALVNAPDIAPPVRRWQDCEYVNIQTAAQLLACSTSQVYALSKEHRINLVKLLGRTCVPTSDIARLLGEVTPWSPGTKTKAALAERERLAAKRIVR